MTNEKSFHGNYLPANGKQPNDNGFLWSLVFMIVVFIIALIIHLI